MRESGSGSSPTAPGGALPDVLLIAAWFGLVSGLVEGAVRLTLQHLGRATWLMWQTPVWLQFLWVPALVNLALFGAIGLGVVASARLFPTLPATRLAVFLFVFLTSFDWLSQPGRIGLIGLLPLAVGLAAQFDRWFRRHEVTALRFLRRTLPWVAAAVLLVLAVVEGGTSAGERRAEGTLPPAQTGSPNILVIVVDSLRADHLSSYGYERPISPNLDRLAREGVLFENAVATSSWSLPTHASMVTGRYAYEHGAISDKTLDRRYPTIAEALRGSGYRTGGFSANHNIFCRALGFGRGFIRFEDIGLADTFFRTFYGRIYARGLRRLSADNPTRRRALSINTGLLHWIQKRAGAPFFAFLNYYDVHLPYLPPPAYRRKFEPLKKTSLPHRPHPSLSRADLQGRVDEYDSAISYVDDLIGRLLGGLREMGALNNTVVVVTSDHGETFGEHGLDGHGRALYRELIHVPLLIRWPGRVPAGMRVTQEVSLAALPATLMEMSGGLAREGGDGGGPRLFPGPSLVSLWRSGPGTRPWPYPLSELEQVPAEDQRFPIAHGAFKSLFGPRWHYITHEKFGAELFDRVADPEERNSVAQTPEGRRAVVELDAVLREMLARPRPVGPAP